MRTYKYLHGYIQREYITSKSLVSIIFIVVLKLKNVIIDASL